MGYYLDIMLVVVPGFACRLFYEKLNEDRKIKDGFLLTVSSLMYGAWVLLLNFVILRLAGIASMTAVKENLAHMDFAVMYGALTLFSCGVVAVAWSFLNPVFTYPLINLLRHLAGKGELGAHFSVWDGVFNAGGASGGLVHGAKVYQHVRIKKDNQILTEGFVTQSSLGTERERALCLVKQEIPPGVHAGEVREYVDLEKDLIFEVQEFVERE